MIDHLGTRIDKHEPITAIVIQRLDMYDKVARASTASHEQLFTLVTIWGYRRICEAWPTISGSPSAGVVAWQQVPANQQAQASTFRPEAMATANTAALTPFELALLMHATQPIIHTGLIRPSTRTQRAAAGVATQSIMQHHVLSILLKLGFVERVILSTTASHPSLKGGSSGLAPLEHGARQGDLDVTSFQAIRRRGLPLTGNFLEHRRSSLGFRQTYLRLARNRARPSFEVPSQSAGSV